ncbi:hypothetical protein D3C76_160640 [compost metagenome]
MYQVERFAGLGRATDEIVGEVGKFLIDFGQGLDRIDRLGNLGQLAALAAGNCRAADLLQGRHALGAQHQVGYHARIQGLGKLAGNTEDAVILVVAHLLWLETIGLAEVPLARKRGGITRFGQQARRRLLRRPRVDLRAFTGKDRASQPGTGRQASRHHCRACRRARGLGIGGRQLQATLGQVVDVRRRCTDAGTAAVGPHIPPPQVIDQQDQDIRLASGTLFQGCQPFHHGLLLLGMDNHRLHVFGDDLRLDKGITRSNGGYWRCDRQGQRHGERGQIEPCHYYSPS